jgi:drug/metabolite transporter (DMT)-like permease
LESKTSDAKRLARDAVAVTRSALPRIVLSYQIITSEGAAVASTVTYLLPVVAIALGVVVLGESVTVAVLVGIALVLIGVALTRRKAPQERPQ